MVEREEDEKLWTATAVIITKGRTEEEARRNAECGILLIDDVIKDYEEENLTHIEDKAYRDKLRRNILLDLRDNEKRRRFGVSWPRVG